jgi:hypothetical protein
MIRLAAAGVLLLCTTGCWWISEWNREQQEAHRAEMTAKVSAWVGHTSAELLQQEGPPSVVLDDPAGAKIWVYTTEASTLVPGPITLNKVGDSYQASQSNGHIETTKTSRMYWIDQAGKVIRADWHEK